MDRDQQLVQDIRSGPAPAVLRIYQWAATAVSVGRAQRLEDLPENFRNGRYPVVRRPTGGGAVLHEPGETTYALALKLSFCPRPLHDLPVQIHRKLLDRLRASSLPDLDRLTLVCGGSREPVRICFTSPACGDLLYRGRKVAGSAVRVWKEALLLQGSVQGLPLPSEELRNLLPRAVQDALSA